MLTWLVHFVRDESEGTFFLESKSDFWSQTIWILLLNQKGIIWKMNICHDNCTSSCSSWWKKIKNNSKLILRAKRNGKSNIVLINVWRRFFPRGNGDDLHNYQFIYELIWNFSYGKSFYDLEVFFSEFNFTTLAWGVMIILTDAWKSAFIKKFVIIDISFSRWKEGINHLFIRYVNIQILFFLICPKTKRLT